MDNVSIIGIDISKRREHQIPWGQSSRHRQLLDVQTSTSNARSPVRRMTVWPFDPTDLGASVPPRGGPFR